MKSITSPGDALLHDRHYHQHVKNLRPPAFSFPLTISCSSEGCDEFIQQVICRTEPLR